MKMKKVLVSMTDEISNDYATNVRSIAETPHIDTNLWRAASLWLRSARYFHDHENPYLNYVASSIFNNDNFDEKFVSERNHCNYKSLKTYQNDRFGHFWTVQLSTSDWKNGSKCDCPIFLKNYICKHVVGISLKNKLCRLPRKALTVELTKKLKKGRKPKATSALTI